MIHMLYSIPSSNSVIQGLVDATVTVRTRILRLKSSSDFTAKEWNRVFTRVAFKDCFLNLGSVKFHVCCVKDIDAVNKVVSASLVEIILVQDFKSKCH